MLLLMVLQRVVGLSRNILFCRFLDPAELGRWNLAFSILVLAAPLIILGLPGSFGRYVEHYRQQGQLRTFLHRTTWMTVICACLGVATLALFAEQFAWLFLGGRSEIGLVWTIGTALLLVIAFNYFIELFTALRQVRVVSLMRFGHSVLFAICALGMVLGYGASAVSVVKGYGFACLITGCVAIIPLTRTWRDLPQPASQLRHTDLWAKLLPFAALIWFSDLIGNLFGAADRYMIVHFAGLPAAAAVALVGQYHSSRVIPELIVSFGDVLAGLVMPYQTDDWEKGHRQRVSDKLHLTFKLYGLAATMGGCVVLVVAPWLFSTVLGGKYNDGLQVLPWTMTYCIWFGMCVILNNYLLCGERAGSRGLSLAVGLGVNVVLNFILLPRFGLLGAVLATAAGNLTVMTAVYISVRRAGMNFDFGTLVIAALPILLAMGALVTALSLAATAMAACTTDWIFTRIQRQFVEKEICRVRRWLGPILRIGASRTVTVQSAG